MQRPLLYVLTNTECRLSSSLYHKRLMSVKLGAPVFQLFALLPESLQLNSMLSELDPAKKNELRCFHPIVAI